MKQCLYFIIKVHQQLVRLGLTSIIATIIDTTIQITASDIGRENIVNPYHSIWPYITCIRHG